jgi:O-antigen/teichoic acid export membrane protein
MTLTRFRPVIFLLSGNLLGAAVGGVFFLTATQRFSLEEMGHYAVAISFQWVMFGIIGTGLSIATIRFARDYYAVDDRAGATSVMTQAAIGVVGLTVILAACAYGALALLRPWLQMNPVLGLLAVSWAGARALLDTIRSGLLAQENFLRTAILSTTSGVTGLIALSVVVLTGELTVTRILIAHVAGLFLGALASLPLVGLAGFNTIRRASFRTLVSYARWPAISEGLRLLQTNLGAPLLVALTGSAQAGVFGLGRYPAYVFDVIAVSLYQFWLARAVRVTSHESMRGYIKRQSVWAGGLGIAMVTASVLAQPLLPLLDEDLALAGPLFVLSAIDFAILLMIRPIETAFHGLRRPRLELMQRSIGIPVLLLVALMLAPTLESIGMALAHIATSLVSLAFGWFLLHRALAAPAAT